VTTDLPYGVKTNGKKEKIRTRYLTAAPTPSRSVSTRIVTWGGGFRVTVFNYRRLVGDPGKDLP
jgi:hypothetical protein